MSQVWRLDVQSQRMVVTRHLDEGRGSYASSNSRQGTESTSIWDLYAFEHYTPGAPSFLTKPPIGVMAKLRYTQPPICLLDATAEQHYELARGGGLDFQDPSGLLCFSHYLPASFGVSRALHNSEPLFSFPRLISRLPDLRRNCVAVSQSPILACSWRTG